MLLLLLLLSSLLHCYASDTALLPSSPHDTHYFTFGLVADNHYDTFPSGEKAPWQPMNHWFNEQVKRTTNHNKRRYDLAKDKMDEAIDVFNRCGENMTLVVNLGDLVNNDLMWNLRPILDSFNGATAPHFSILGNHDLRAHNDRFGKYNSSQHEWIRRKMGVGEDWHYSLDLPPFKLIFVDSMVMEPEALNATKKNEHLKWLIDTIEDARRHEWAVVVFAHIPIGVQTNVLGPCLRGYDHIIAAFFGHDHKGGYLQQGNIHSVTIHGQIETMVNAFALVEVFGDRLEMTGFGRVPSRVMKIAPTTITLLQKYYQQQQREERNKVGGRSNNDSSNVVSSNNVGGRGRRPIAEQGHQPLPPEKLWDEDQQSIPPLLLNIPNYKKPLVGVTDPNPGDTRFLKSVYHSWPRRIRTLSPEAPVDLNSANRGKAVWLIHNKPYAGELRADQVAQLHRSGSSSKDTEPSSNQHPVKESMEAPIILANSALKPIPVETRSSVHRPTIKLSHVVVMSDFSSEDHASTIRLPQVTIAISVVGSLAMIALRWHRNRRKGSRETRGPLIRAI